MSKGGRHAHIPLRLEALQAPKRFRHGLVRQYRLVLFEGPVADFGVVSLWDRILEEGLFELVESYDDAEKFRQGVL